MRRHPLSGFLVACCLSGVWLLALSPAAAPGADLLGLNWAPFTNWLGDPGIWGRVNPGVSGYPHVSVASDVVVLSRPAPQAQTVLFDGAFQPLFDASQLDSTAAAGGRFNVTLFDSSGWDLMFEGLFMDEFDRQRTVDASGGVNLIFYQGLALATVDTVSYRSRLDTGEFNVRRRFSPRFALLAGIRELQLAEDFDLTVSSTGNSGYFSQTGNRLFGAQIGAEGVIPARGYGRFFACGKYGIYNNHFQVAAQAASSGSLIHINERDDMTAYVGDFNAGFEIQTVPCMTLRFGYQALWLTNVALSPDQLNQYSIFTGDGSVHKSSPVYHGGFIGLVFTF